MARKQRDDEDEDEDPIRRLVGHDLAAVERSRNDRARAAEFRKAFAKSQSVGLDRHGMEFIRMQEVMIRAMFGQGFPLQDYGNEREKAQISRAALAALDRMAELAGTAGCRRRRRLSAKGGAEMRK